MKGVDYLYESQGQSKAKKYNNARYSIGNVSMKDLPNIIREFENVPYKSYESRRPKNEPTYNYFYPARHLVKCMIRADALNSHVYSLRTEITGTKHIPISHVCSMEECKLE